MCVDIVNRYSFSKQLVATKLLNKKSFTSFENDLPTEKIGLTTETYLMIDKEKLETEIRLFYSRSVVYVYCKLIVLQ